MTWGCMRSPQGFARLSAVYGGTFMLDTPFKGVVTDDDGEVCCRSACQYHAAGAHVAFEGSVTA